MGGRKMKGFKRGRLGHLKLIGIAVAIFAFASCAVAAPYDQVLQRWTKTNQYKNDIGAEMWISASYYAAEYIEALVQAEADKNLWTEDELERYKYELLKALQLEEYLPFRIEFDNRASPISMAPFDEQVTLWIGNKKYKPMDYDKRFNFKLSGKRDGMVYFPRYDEKGKSLLDGVKSVKLFDEKVRVAAEIVQLPGISGHADVNKLIDWVTHIQPKPQHVFVNHGESDVSDGFSQRLNEEFGLTSSAPYSGSVFDLGNNAYITLAPPVATQKAQKAAEEPTPAYKRLLAALERLTALVKKFPGRANREVDTLTRALDALADGWERM